jgi:hypothetical protein
VRRRSLDLIWLKNQTARGHPALKGRGMLRAARPFFRNSEIIESSLPRFF